MTEYIRREALLNEIAKIRTKHGLAEGEEMEFTETDIAGLLLCIPAADVAEVVRCKNCKHWKHFDHLGCTDFAKVCGLANYMTGENGFCLYGERKGGDADGQARDGGSIG